MIVVISFTKMQGLGNDFMVVDAVRQSIHLKPDQIKALARRDTGIGFDQCLWIEASSQPDIDFFYRIFNSDGTEVGQCGNGARCVARFILNQGLSNKAELSIATYCMRMRLWVNTDETVTVEMPSPVFAPESIPLAVPEQAPTYPVVLDSGVTYAMHATQVGNPHAILVVNELSQIAIAQIGREISEHRLFPEHTNVGFMQIVAPDQVLLRVYERGSGLTQACGSGAVAAMAVGRRYHHLSEHVMVKQPGGELRVDWPELDGPIYQTGPAVVVYEGRVDLTCGL